MAVRHSTEFKAEALRIARSSDRSMKHEADRFGYSTLITGDAEADDVDLNVSRRSNLSP